MIFQKKFNYVELHQNHVILEHFSTSLPAPLFIDIRLSKTSFSHDNKTAKLGEDENLARHHFQYNFNNMIAEENKPLQLSMAFRILKQLIPI